MLKKMSLIILLLINSFYYFFYIFNFENLILIHTVWTLVFIIGIITSTYFLYHYLNKSGYSLYLSLAVLITSVTSLGAFSFRHLIQGLF